MAVRPSDRPTPAWLRPLAVTVIVLAHAATVLGLPWLSQPELAVSGPLAIRIVPQGQALAAISAPAQVQVAEVNAIETKPTDAPPSEAKEIEAQPIRDVQADEAVTTSAISAPVKISRAIEPDAQDIVPVETHEQPRPDDSDKPKAVKPKEAKPKAAKQKAVKRKHKKPSPKATADSARSQAHAVSQRASAQAAGGSQASANYRSIVAAELNRRKFYPPSARASGIEGVVVVKFTIGAAGSVISHHITRSSGQPQFDRAVHQMMASVSVPPPPGGSFRATVPIRFGFAR